MKILMFYSSVCQRHFSALNEFYFLSQFCLYSPVPKHSYSVLARQFSIVVDATLEIDEIEVIVDRRIWFRFEPRSDFSSSCGAISSCSVF